ncbi:hypothetical protein [Bradyrhizobium sp. UFLA05-112]
MNTKHLEAFSPSSAASTVFVGRDPRGNWVACEQNGSFGGLFVNRAEAFKYALFENGHHPELIIELTQQIELIFPLAADRRYDVPRVICRAIEKVD